MTSYKQISFFIALVVLTMACAVSTTTQQNATMPPEVSITPMLIYTVEEAGTPQISTETQQPSIYMVAADTLNLRACGSTFCAVIGDLYTGDEVQFTGSVSVDAWRGEWWHVKTADKSGWVNSAWLEAK